MEEEEKLQCQFARADSIEYTYCYRILWILTKTLKGEKIMRIDGNCMNIINKSWIGGIVIVISHRDLWYNTI